MAESKNRNEEKTEEVKVVAETKPVVEELNMDEKIVIKSISSGTTTFQRSDGMGDVIIPANGTVRLPRHEVISQIQNNHKLFTGTDGHGSHATLYIDDKPTRLEVEFDTEDKEQLVFTEGQAKKLFAISKQNEFEKACKEIVQTNTEKRAAVEAAKKLKVNDYNKIHFLEQYTKLKMD